MERIIILLYTRRLHDESDITGFKDKKKLPEISSGADKRKRTGTDQDKETIEELSKMNAKIMGVTSDPFYGAPTVLIVLADKNRNTYLEDGSLVMGNLMNAAHAVGVASCWIHRAKEEFESAEGKEILKELGIEGDYEGIGHLALGYADGEPSSHPINKNRFFFAE